MLYEMEITSPVSSIEQRKDNIKLLSTSVNPIRLKNNPVYLDEVVIELLYEVIVK